jgi:ABC-type cobalamin/Fe3+-siderophores transport system ATPase subunit
MTTPILAARGLDVTIAGKRICDGLDLTVAAGDCWAILGRNGAGKTTLLHTLAGLRAPAAGTIELLGRSVSVMTRRELARLRGVLPQDDSDAFPATVLETVLIGRHPHLSRWQWEGPDDIRVARDALEAPKRVISRRSPAASGAALPWPLCSRRSHGCFCSTSRPVISMSRISSPCSTAW